jgi:hypothetical protein
MVGKVWPLYEVTDASGLDFLCQDKTLFLKMEVQSTENQRNSLTAGGCSISI